MRVAALLLTSLAAQAAVQFTDVTAQAGIRFKHNSGRGRHPHTRADHETIFTTKLRITMLQLSAGAKYDPSLIPNLLK